MTKSAISTTLIDVKSYLNSESESYKICEQFSKLCTEDYITDEFIKTISDSVLLKLRCSFIRDIKDALKLLSDTIRGDFMKEDEWKV